MTFRLLLQPAAAMFLAARAGLKDAREDRPLYFWSIFTDPVNRREILRDGWKDVAKVFAMAVVIDFVYQIIALRWIYPGEALIVAALLAILPYLIFRGLLNRAARSRSRAAVASDRDERSGF